MEKMEIYQAARAVPPEAKKEFNNGKFSGTDINPMWRIKKLTELFGPAGVGWYYEVISERAEEHHDMTMAIVDLNLYIKVDGEWSKPIYGTGGNTLVKSTKSGTSSSDEGYKMALTDALSVACKALGIGADVYFEKDRTKYTAAQGGETKQSATRGNKKLLELEEKIKAAGADDEGLEPPPLVCADCGAELVEYSGNNGVTITPDRHAARCAQKFGRVLCLECIKKEMERRA